MSADERARYRQSRGERGSGNVRTPLRPPTPVRPLEPTPIETWGAFLREQSASAKARFKAMMPPKTPDGPDRILCGVILVLTALGVVMVFSAGAALGARLRGDWTFFLKRELMYVAAGLAAFTFAARTDYAAFRRITYPLLIFTVVALVGVLVFGKQVGGLCVGFAWAPSRFNPPSSRSLR